MKSRRLCRVFVYPDLLWALLHGWKQGEFLQLPRFKDLPKDEVLRDTYYDYDRAMFGFILEHPSFDEVPEGYVMPTHETELEVIKIR